jgi:hypothetical protein
VDPGLGAVTAVADGEPTTISADDMVVMALQAATQWDSLAHVGYDGHFYTGALASPLTPRAAVTPRPPACGNPSW